MQSLLYLRMVKLSSKPKSDLLPRHPDYTLVKLVLEADYGAVGLYKHKITREKRLFYHCNSSDFLTNISRQLDVDDALFVDGDFGDWIHILSKGTLYRRSIVDDDIEEICPRVKKIFITRMFDEYLLEEDKRLTKLLDDDPVEVKVLEINVSQVKLDKREHLVGIVGGKRFDIDVGTTSPNS